MGREPRFTDDKEADQPHSHGIPVSRALETRGGQLQLLLFLSDSPVLPATPVSTVKSPPGYLSAEAGPAWRSLRTWGCTGEPSWVPARLCSAAERQRNHRRKGVAPSAEMTGVAHASRLPRQEEVWNFGLCWPRAGPWTRGCPVWPCSWQRTQKAGMELGPFPGQLRMLSSQITRPGRKSLIQKPVCVSPACLSRPRQSVSSRQLGTKDSGPSGETEVECKVSW